MTVTDILRTVARYRRLALLAAVLTLAIGVVAAFSPPDRFRSASTVLVQPKLANGQAVSVQVVDFLVPSFVRTIETRSFREGAAERLRAAARSADVSVSTSATTGTGILTISASSTDRDAVAPWAQALASELVEEIESDFVELTTIDTALPPSGPYAPNRPLILGVTLVMAIIDALLAATIANAVRGRGDRVSELRERFGAAVLGEIPRVRGGIADLSPEELLENPAAARVAEALQTLRANVTIALEERAHPWLVVTSAEPSEGKSMVSTSLAWLLGTVHRPTILVDGDSRRPSAHRRLRASLGDGLGAVGPGDLDQHLQATGSPTLRFLGAGSPDRHPAEVASNHLPHLLHQAEASGDIVLIDSPPLPVAAETIVYASGCQNVLLVIDARKRDLRNVERVITTLHDRDVHILGVVINRSRRRVRAGYYAQGTPRRIVADAALPPVEAPVDGERAIDDEVPVAAETPTQVEVPVAAEPAEEIEAEAEVPAAPAPPPPPPVEPVRTGPQPVLLWTESPRADDRA